MTTATILIVDDEPNILEGYRRALRDRFQVVTAHSGEEGLAAVQDAVDQLTPFSVVVSDMMMPTMNGAEFLVRTRAIAPDAIQLLLSGQADLDSTIAAVNNGNLFRFLTKPCSTPDLEWALAAAVEQHRLVAAERDLLDRTLAGAVDVLIDLLSMASPEAFTRTERVRNLTTQTALILGLEDWRLPLAAMLSQIGCSAVPDDVLHRARLGAKLTPDERDVYYSHPRIARALLERIPRLEDVARWIGDQPVTLDDALKPVMDPAEQLLSAVLSYLIAQDNAGHPAKALAKLAVSSAYPQHLLDALSEAVGGLAPQGFLRELKVGQVRPGMLLEADIQKNQPSSWTVFSR